MTNGLRILTLDVETTIYKICEPPKRNGNPFAKENKCVSLAMKWLGKPTEKFDTLEGRGRFPLNLLREYVAEADVIVGHHIKYDIHWIVRESIDLDSIKRVWCTQLGEFMLGSQNNPYPSLNAALIKYELPTKMDVVEQDYWNKGIDTDEIPIEILLEYNGYDVEGTEEVFKRQWLQLVGTSL